MNWTKTTVVAGMVVALNAGAWTAVHAQTDSYPGRPVRFIVPYPPGGTTDIVGRGIATKLSEAMGQQVVVDNRGGASTIIGADLAAKSLPDGYTLLLVTATTLSINPHVYPKLPYDTVRDFAPITPAVTVPYVIAAHPSLPANTIPELITLAKAKPGTFSYGTPGTASTNHLGGALLETMTGIKLLHVPFKGSGPAMTGVIGGQVHMIITGIATVVPHAKSGKAKILAYCAEKRHPNLPDVPSTGEAGLKGYSAGTWFGVVTRAGTPRAIVNRLNKEIVAALASPDLRDRLILDRFPRRHEHPGGIREVHQGRPGPHGKNHQVRGDQAGVSIRAQIR
ncbi:MAG: tripartite tricarboxylate transporter substrate binding protein [Burkholderiales bacterium]|nr:tripartite tricarboxylate transporter substrate binding protein [Burkholderiales bacterium]